MKTPVAAEVSLRRLDTIYCFSYLRPVLLVAVGRVRTKTFTAVFTMLASFGERNPIAVETLYQHSR